MSSSQPSTPTSPLPQYGFSTDIDFDSLVKTNRFLFRVYTPKHQLHTSDDTDLFFVAPKFDERYALSPKELTWQSNDRLPVSQTATFEDIARHMDWTKRSTSAYISTSFSFIWSIWEALRRYHQNVKKDVEIAVIDATLLAGKAATAVQILRKAESYQRKREYWKWYRFAQESQSVLVHECIAKNAVYASIPLLQLLEKLPSYFLRPDAAPRDSPLAAIAWDYKEKKPNYRQFCQQMSNNFLQSSQDVRLRDTTTGSVRLAAVFLRPWFHIMVSNNSFELAIATLRDLASSIARWPGQWWARDHSEMWDLIKNMAIALAEEIRQEQRVQAGARRRQPTEDHLERFVRHYQDQIDLEERTNSSDPHSPTSVKSIFSSPIEDLPPAVSSVRRRQSLVLTIPWSTGPGSSSPSPSPPESLFSARNRHFPRHIMGSLADASDLLWAQRSIDTEPRSRTLSMPELVAPPSPLSETGSFYSPSGPSSPVVAASELPASSPVSSPQSSPKLPASELPSDSGLFVEIPPRSPSLVPIDATISEPSQSQADSEAPLPSLDEVETLTPLDTSRAVFSLPSKLSPIPESPDAVLLPPLPDSPVGVALPSISQRLSDPPLSPSKVPLPDSSVPPVFIPLPDHGHDDIRVEHEEHEEHDEYDHDHTLCLPLGSCPSPSPSTTSTLPNTPTGNKLSLPHTPTSSRPASPSNSPRKLTSPQKRRKGSHLASVSESMTLVPSEDESGQVSLSASVEMPLTQSGCTQGEEDKGAASDGSSDSTSDADGWQSAATSLGASADGDASDSGTESEDEEDEDQGGFFSFYNHYYPIRLFPLSFIPSSASRSKKGKRRERKKGKQKVHEGPEPRSADAGTIVDHDAGRHSPARRRFTSVEKASCLVTGFLFGAVITWAMLSPPRRTLITNLT
ncbi:hypothetical protein AX16_003383 [Volvariella volvacea WC 439]|nr:hypothetical protein AX16_003383 [Volvariella volvacea WC 439]